MHFSFFFFFFSYITCRSHHNPTLFHLQIPLLPLLFYVRIWEVEEIENNNNNNVGDESMQDNSGNGTVLLWSARHDSYLCYQLPELDSRGDICNLLHAQVWPTPAVVVVVAYVCVCVYNYDGDGALDVMY